MANTFDRVSLNIMSLKDFQDAELAYCVIKKINEYGEDFIPSAYDLYQPLKKKYDPNNISEIVRFWMNEDNNIKNAQDSYAAGQLLMEKKRGYKVSYHMEWEKDNQARFNFFNLSIDISYFNNENRFQQFKNLCNELVLLLEPAQGEIVNLSFPGWETPINLRVRHPEINWIAYFGKPYIDMFGREKLLSTPCHSVHTIGDNVIALQLTDSLFEPIPQSVRSTVKRHLGEDALVEEGKSYRSYKTGKVPEFDFSNVLFDKTKPIVEPQIRTKQKS